MSLPRSRQSARVQCTSHSWKWNPPPPGLFERQTKDHFAGALRRSARPVHMNVRPCCIQEVIRNAKVQGSAVQSVARKWALRRAYNFSLRSNTLLRFRHAASDVDAMEYNSDEITRTTSPFPGTPMILNAMKDSSLHDWDCFQSVSSFIRGTTQLQLSDWVLISDKVSPRRIGMIREMVCATTRRQLVLLVAVSDASVPSEGDDGMFRISSKASASSISVRAQAVTLTLLSLQHENSSERVFSPSW